MPKQRRPKHAAGIPGRVIRPVDPTSAKQPPGRHRASRRPAPDPLGVRRPRGATALRAALATAVAGGLAFVVAAEPPTTTGPAADPASIAVAERAAAAADRAASRSLDRSPRPASPTPGASRRATAAPSTPARVRPVAGLSQAQMDNARAIVEVGRAQKIPRFGLIVAVATAMQESNLRNLANGAVPESMNLPHQGVGWDHDSVGLFQQRSSTGWGSVRDLMRPEYAAGKFFAALRAVPGWERLSLAQAAQRVQKSAFPDAYAKHEARATAVVDALLP